MMMLLTFDEDSNEVDVNWYSVCNDKLFHPQPVYHHGSPCEKKYTVTLPTETADAGYTVAAADGSASPVLENGFFSFTVNIADGYQKGAGFAVKANGDTLTAEADGKYTISNIAANQIVTVEGVEAVATHLPPIQSPSMPMAARYLKPLRIPTKMENWLRCPLRPTAVATRLRAGTLRPAAD